MQRKRQEWQEQQAARATRAARTARTTTHRGERRAFLGWQYAKAEVSNFQTNSGLMRYMTSTTMYRCTTWMRQQGTRVLQEKSFIRDTFSSCNNGTADGRDRQLDRQIGVTSRIVEYDHCWIISPWKPKSLEYKYTNTGAIAGCTVLQTSYVRKRGTRKEGPENIRKRCQNCQ